MTNLYSFAPAMQPQTGVSAFSRLPHPALSMARYVEQLCDTHRCDDSPFKCVSTVPVSLVSFAERLATFMQCSEAVFVIAATLIGRLHAQYPQIFGARSAHKLLATGCVVAAKFTDDKYYTNVYYAQCAGVSLQELNFMEAALFRLLGFTVFVSLECFEITSQLLVRLDELAVSQQLTFTTKTTTPQQQPPFYEDRIETNEPWWTELTTEYTSEELFGVEEEDDQLANFNEDQFIRSVFDASFS